MQRLPALCAALALVASVSGAVTFAPPARAATLIEVTSFGSNPGGLHMYEYLPAGLPAHPALVVVLPGCNMTAAQQATQSGWPTVADHDKFAVVVAQSDALNKCFGPGDKDTLRGGGGDADSIAQMVTYEEQHHAVDTARVFAAGFSSGAMMTNVMLGAYPDLFAAGSADAGIPYRCADDEISETKCGLGRNLTPQQWGDRVRAANPGTWTWPRMLIIHGTGDPAVDYSNLTEEMQEWTNLNGIDQVADTSDYVDGYPHKVYRNAAGQSRVETYTITGAGHNNLVDVGTGVGQCGATALGTSYDVNFCAAYWSARFFGLVTGPAPTRTFLDSAAQDGTVKAWAGGFAATVGTDESDGLQIGRAGDTKISRAFLSFDTAAIPDTAKITRAWLFVTVNSTQGEPFDDPIGNKIAIDIRTGCFSTSCSTQTADWNASATASNVATIAKPGASVQWSSDLDAAGLAAINKTGTTQFRLRFAHDQALLEHLYLGNGTTARLVVQY